MHLLSHFFPSRTIALWSLMAGGISALLPPSVWAQDGPAIVAALEDSFAKIIEDAEPSVVSIARFNKFKPREIDHSGEGNQFAPGLAPAGAEDYTPSEFGAGIVFAHPEHPDQNLILTMYHVVKGGQVAGRDSRGTDELVIHTHKRLKARVEILAADPRSDLAVLRIQEGEKLKASDLIPVSLAKNPHYRKGQFVITLGNPYAIARDGSACAGWGMLGNIARRPKPLGLPLGDLERNKRETVHHLGTLLQIDGQLNLGTSGGAVLNRKGELIGIVTAMAALAGYEKSVGYAVPLDGSMKRIITELANGYEVEYGLLGISPLTTNFPPGEQPTAVKVEATGLKSPASLAGVFHDDLIYAVNGVTCYTQEDLMREVAMMGPGRVARLQIYRPQTKQWLVRNVKLTKWPVYNDEDIIATQPRYVWNNIQIDQANGRYDIQIDHATGRYDFFGQQYRQAVLVTRIKRESGENLSRLRVGDFITHVDDQAVATPQEFMEAVKGKAKGETVYLRRLGDRTIPVQVSD